MVAPSCAAISRSAMAEISMPTSVAGPMKVKRSAGDPPAERDGWLISIGREAVDLAGAARGLELVLAAAARAVRGVPRLHVPGVLEALQVVVADDGRALAVL